ncbi:MAG: hypothetical protein HKN36_04765 [Hellea sp.]|nr:hypothetical protein [Hellea sp.]
MRDLLCTAAALFALSGPSYAQSIDVGQLGSAEAYEPGTLTPADGALGNNLWASTPADVAEELILDLPQNFQNPIARELTRRALLSPGVPPMQDGDGSFSGNRLGAIIKLSELSAAQDIAQRSPGLASSQELRADLALLSGDISSACTQSDSILEKRAEIYWMKLRAFCHVERGETAAAELTLDLIRSSGDNDKGYTALMRSLTGVPGRPDVRAVNGSPLSIAMMASADIPWPAGQQPPASAAQTAFNAVKNNDERFKALLVAAPAMSDGQIRQILDSLGAPESGLASDLAGGVMETQAPITLETAMSDKGGAGFAQLYHLSRSGSQEEQLPALIELLSRADKANQFARFAKLVEPQLQGIYYPDLTAGQIPMIAKTAALRGDIIALQQLHGLMDDNTAHQDRIALAADAIGNGFFGGALGTDIETRLREKNSRALRDALIAYGLGANLSDTAAHKIFSQRNNLGRLSGKGLLLQSAARRRAQAETALRAALMLESGALSDLDMFLIIDSLYNAGLNEQAGKLAALDFLEPLSGQ